MGKAKKSTPSSQKKPATVKGIIKAIEDAQCEWIGRDWETQIGTYIGQDGYPTPIYADHRRPSDCSDEEWKDAQEELEKIDSQIASDASKAEEFGDRAIAALKKRDYETALQYLRDASGKEQKYGDDPTWRGPRKMLEEFLERRK